MTKSLRNTFADTVLDLGKTDSSLVVMVGDISHGILQPFAEAFPDRYYNIGILEPSMISIAAGLSKVGFVPVIHTIAPFLIERTFEQIKLDFGYHGLAGNLISVGGTFDYSQLGVSHHSYSDVALVSQIPGTKIFLPGSSEEFRKLFLENYNSIGVKYFRLTESPHGVDLQLPEVLGLKSILVSPGDDITVLTTGAMLRECMEAKNILSGEASIQVLYFPTLGPFDSQGLLERVKRTGKYLVVEELSVHGGLGHRVLEALENEEGVSGKRMGVSELIHAYGSRDDLLAQAGLSVPDIVEALRIEIGSS